VNLLDDGVGDTLGLVSTMAAAHSPACLNGSRDPNASRISKLASSAPREHSSVRPQNVVNLMDALRSSIACEKNTSAPAKKGGKRVAGQTEATDMASRFPGWSQSDSLTTSNVLRRLRERLKPRSYLSSALASSVWHAHKTCRQIDAVWSRPIRQADRPSFPAICTSSAKELAFILRIT
jgi:hypothetical protein